MSVQIKSGASTDLLGVGAVAASPAHVTIKPIPYAAFGHYRTNHRCLGATTAQAANSRIFEIRNSHLTHLIVATRLVIKCVQSGFTNAAQETSFDVFRVTGFTAVDTTNTVTPTASSKSALSMPAGPGAAVLRGLTVAGAAAGMTGGTLTKDGNSIVQVPVWSTAALPTGSTVIPMVDDNMLDDLYGSPLIFAQNEGLIIENRASFSNVANISVYIDFSWAEVTTF